MFNINSFYRTEVLKLPYLFFFFYKNDTHENFLTHEIPTSKNLVPRNTNERKFQIQEILTRKKIGPMKYP